MFGVLSIIVVGGATSHECYNARRYGPKGHNSTERARPKSFITSFSIIHNYHQMFDAPRRHHLHIVEHSNSRHRPFSQQSDQHSFPRTSTNSSISNSTSGPFLVMNTSVFDGLKVAGLLWVCLANYYWLGFQPQMLPSVGKLLTFESWFPFNHWILANFCYLCFNFQTNFPTLSSHFLCIKNLFSIEFSFLKRHIYSLNCRFTLGLFLLHLQGFYKHQKFRYILFYFLFSRGKADNLFIFVFLSSKIF